MLLKNKNAVLFAAGGSLGGAIARGLAKAGAKVFLSNHHIRPIQKLADEIIAEGGHAEAAQVDALNEKHMNTYMNEVVKKAGTVDISMNLIKTEDVQGIPLVGSSSRGFYAPHTKSKRRSFHHGHC